MNPILKAVSEVKWRVPPPILAYAFREQTYRWRSTPINIDEQIINKVIRPRVMVDCDLVGGTEVLIQLDGMPRENVDPLTIVYNIPKHHTNGRTITSVLSVSYVNAQTAAYLNQNQNFAPCSTSPVLVAGQAMMDAMTPGPVPSSARVQLIGENTVMIREVALVSGIGYLRCILANDENLSHLQMRSLPHFCKLVELAVKAYIYNQTIVEVDEGVLQGGAEIGKYREIIEGWSDMEEMYQEYLREKMTKVLYMNDRETYERHLKLLIGGFR